MADFGFLACECIGKYVFFCYAHNDTEYVSKVANGLREKGINIWYDGGIPPGTNWMAAISQAMQAASVVIVFISKSMVESDYCYSEISLAQRHKKLRIPVIIEETPISNEVEYAIGSIQYVNEHLSMSIDKIVETLFPLINKAYEGKRSDISVSFRQMNDNVDAFLSAGDWNSAMEESRRMQKTDANSFWGWWCVLKSLTYGQAKVVCKNDYNKQRNIMSIDNEKMDEVYKCYAAAFNHADDENKVKINSYYAQYCNNLNIVGQAIINLNNNFNEYSNSMVKWNDVLKKYTHPDDAVKTAIQSLIACVINFFGLLVYAYKYLYSHLGIINIDFVNILAVVLAILSIISIFFVSVVWSDGDIFGSIILSGILALFSVIGSPFFIIYYIIKIIKIKFDTKEYDRISNIISNIKKENKIVIQNINAYISNMFVIE